MKWSKHEWFNQLKHFIAGLWATWIVFMVHSFMGIIITDYRLLLVGLLVGSIVEIYQFFYQDNRQFHIADRIRDISFYIIGSAVIWLV